MQNPNIVKTTRRPYHHGSLREALIDAAACLLAERGPEGVTLRETARRAGVSQAAPYHYFASKAALVSAVAADARDTLDALQGAALARAGSDSVARLRALVATQIRFALERPHLHGAMTLRMDDPFIDAVREARLAAGHDDLDPAGIATLLWAVPQGLVSVYISGATGVTPVLVEHLARMAVEALLAVPAHDVGGEWAV